MADGVIIAVAVVLYNVDNPWFSKKFFNPEFQVDLFAFLESKILQTSGIIKINYDIFLGDSSFFFFLLLSF